MRRLRWREISMVPQSSMDSLDPVYRVGDAIARDSDQRGAGWAGRRRRSGPSSSSRWSGSRPKTGLNNYPHEFSGGMRQRAVIAMALALDPDLVIADEPVTALDVIVQNQVLRTFRELQERLNLSVIMITHDISVVAETCDEVAVMYAGKIVEWTTVERFFHEPFHPYTLGLQNAYPSLTNPDRTLISIEGYPPDLVDPPQGCRFNTRCPFAMNAASRGAAADRGGAGAPGGVSPLAGGRVRCGPRATRQRRRDVAERRLALRRPTSGR